MNPTPPIHLDAEKILRASRSNFAPAFRLLPPEKRSDLAVLYAFCRLIDDIADDDKRDVHERREALDAWGAGLRNAELRGLPDNFRELVQRRALNPGHCLDLIEGARSDLDATVRMSTRENLDLYCHRVAGSVGLLCLPIFGANVERCSDYAETLGRALQYTNILRDTNSDLQRGRIYYPLNEMDEVHLTPENFSTNHKSRQAYLERFADSAEELFKKAARLSPAADHQALRPARIMASAYSLLLRKMRRNGLRVMSRNYRLSPLEKLRAVTTAFFDAGKWQSTPKI